MGHMPMKCSICKAPIDEADAGKEGSFFPFCSDRCRLIDLGRWLDGKYAIPVSRRDADADADASEPPAKERRPKSD
jgi:endogenous inhibitor of DNA gyrase (YacG/DUF329 family)